MEAELHILQEDSRKYLNNPLLGYLNIISVREKITDLWIAMQSLPPDYLALRETKLDKYGSDEIEMKIVVVLLSLLKGELFVKALLTSN